MTRASGFALLSRIAGRKSTHSQDSACVVVAAVAHCAWVGIRDGKLPAEDAVAQAVVVPLDRFRQFVESLR